MVTPDESRSRSLAPGKLTTNKSEASLALA